MTIKKILPSTPEAATYKTGIQGWVDRHGGYWGKDLISAQYAGATHVKCKKCSNVVKKHSYTICRKCRDKADMKKFRSMSIVEWDGETPIYSRAIDKYIYCEDELEELMEEHGLKRKDMLLVLCEAIYFNKLDLYHFCDELGDDEDDLPEDLECAIGHLNDVISNLPPASWSIGNKRIK